VSGDGSRTTGAARGAGAALDWDAATYHRVAAPQEAWAREILARLPLAGDEVVLDAGCGSGRVTRLLLERLPRGAVVGVDASPSMIERARDTLGDDERVTLLCQNLVELSVPAPVDAIFSCAVFHHIGDHERLFGALRGALRCGGHLVAQCGGEGNIARFRAHADAVAARPPYARYLGDLSGPWYYADPGVTEERLRAASFGTVRCWLEPKPTTPDDARGFAETVLLNYHLEHLRRAAPAADADGLARAFVDDVLAAAGEPLELQYVRLNIDARAV
jgi:trans-aconitate 2-methyltransferase